MKIELEILDGPQKGQRIRPKNGLQIGKGLPFAFNDMQMADLHAIVILDHKKSWNIECLAPLKVRIGSDEVGRISLIMGLVFHIGQTGFKVVEKKPLAYEGWDEGAKNWLNTNPGLTLPSELFFFLYPIRLTFIQGTQFEEFYTISYGPRVLGFNNLDLNLKDPSLPHRAVRFFQISDQAYVENLSNERIKINNKDFDQRPIKNGDLMTIGSNIIELSILK